MAFTRSRYVHVMLRYSMVGMVNRWLMFGATPTRLSLSPKEKESGMNGNAKKGKERRGRQRKGKGVGIKRIGDERMGEGRKGKKVR